MNTIPLPQPLPWAELAIINSLIGAIAVAWVRDPQRAARYCLVFAFLSLCFAMLSAVGFFLEDPSHVGVVWSLTEHVTPRTILAVDDVNAPLLPAVALLHFLAALATPRTKMPRFSFAWLLGLGAIHLATVACVHSWTLVALLAALTVPPYFELRKRAKSTRIYLIHMALFLGLLLLGSILVEVGPAQPGVWAVIPLLLAVLVRCGCVPTHFWLTDLFENATFGTALIIAGPIIGVYAAIRLVLPIAPEWALQSLGLVSLLTAVYAAGMALVQREARRFFVFLWLSHAALVLVGLELVTPISLTGSLSLWFSVILSLGGLGLTLRAIEARHGRLTLTKYHGLYRQSPSLAVFFLLTGLASVGFPGTLGFVATELLVDGAIEANLYIGLAVVLASAMNSIAVVRVYLLLFTGAEHAASVPLAITFRERFAVLTLAALILGGGLIPQPGIATRHLAAGTILKARALRLGIPYHEELAE